MNKKLLLVAHDFPPASDGVFRPLKFTKYLPEFEWQPIVLTLKDSHYSFVDPNLLSELPSDVIVFRTNTLLSQKKTYTFRDKYTATTESKISSKNLDIIGKIALWIRNYLLIPDTKVLWIPFALLATRKILKKHPDIKIVFATAPPYSTLLLGYLIKIIFRKKLVIDFRDPWTQWFDVYREWENAFRKKIEYWLEKKIVMNSEGVVSSTLSIHNYLINKYYSTNKNKFTIIYNGFDSNDYLDIKAKVFEHFTIVYTGKVVNDLYSPENFFKGVHRLFKFHPELSESFKIIFIGEFPRDCEALVHKYNLTNVVIIKGLLTHNECLSYQKGADLLLLLLNEGVTNRYTISGKLFEYFYVGKPVFAVIPEDSAAGDLIKSTCAGIIVDPADIKGISDFLFDYYQKYRHNQTFKLIQKDKILKFERKSLTKELANYLDSLEADN